MLKPFRALRPPPELAANIACLPYDVVSREEARAIAAGNEQCFFHVSRPDIDLPTAVDEHDPIVYATGRANLAKFRERGWLRQDRDPSFYLYRQIMGGHAQTGIVGLADVADYDAGRVRKHEHTRPDKEDDRTEHIRALQANDESVFLTYRAQPEIGAIVAAATAGTPESDITAEDGVRHSVWPLAERITAKLAAELARLPRLYVADGHHRCAAASRAHRLYASEGRSGAHERFLATVFAHDQVQILDYNRAVSDLGRYSSADFLRALEGSFSVTAATDKKPRQAHQLGLYLEGRWYRLQAREGSFVATTLGALDVSILQDNVLGPLLDINDARTDPRVRFVGGIRGVEELERLVDSGVCRAAFALYPTRLDELMAVADAGEVMPPKSTWFEPKLRSGLFVHSFL